MLRISPPTGAAAGWPSEREHRRAKGDYERHGEDIRRYYSIDYKAKSWAYSQRVIAKIEVTSKGTNVRY